MKYCLSARQTKEYLDKADEIYVAERDYRIVPDLLINYPKKTIILEMPQASLEERQSWLLDANKAADGRLICELDTLSNLSWYTTNNIKYFYKYPVNCFYDLHSILALGVSYVLVTAPLTFEIEKLKRFVPEAHYRMVPNIAYDGYIPREDGICGQWVRPEDVEMYENAIEVFQFADCDLEKERSLYRIYAERKHWDGNINFLISNLNKDADNRGLPPEFGKVRANCGQKCMSGGNCHFCEIAFMYEENVRKLSEKLKEYK